MIGSGDQYLEMDDELWRDPGLPEALAMWLTLGLSTKVHEQSGDRLEAWMAAPLGKWQFVGRLTAFGRDDHNRPNYFAHGRAWREDDWRDPVEDPGALFGHPSAFEIPRLAQHGISLETVSDSSSHIVTGFGKLSEGKHAESAAQLVAHLFQAVETGPPVVCVAEIEEFYSHAVLATIIGIARAALPIEVRKKVKIRMYAEQPQAFIESGVHLLAVLPEFAANATGVNATVLHFDDGAIGGPASAPVYDEYGHAVISRARKHPQELLRFGASSNRRLRTALAGDAPIEDSLSVAFDVVRAASFDNAAYDSLLKKRLFPAALGRQQRLTWKELLDRSDWAAFSDNALAEVAVLDAPSTDAFLLRAEVRSELSKRTPHIDDLLERTWQSTSEHASDIIVWTTSGDRRPFSLDTVTRLLHRVSAAVARTLLLDDQCHAQFAELAGRAPLPDEWHELLDVPADEARRMLCAVARRQAPRHWRPWIESWVKIIAGGPITDDVVDAVVAVGATTDDLLVAVAYGDVLASRAAERELAEQLAKQLRTTYPATQWQALVRRSAGRASLFLERYAPLKWLLHCATVEDVATLATILDAHVERAPARGCSELIRADRFCAWLGASTNTALRRRAAVEWLCSTEVSDPLRDWTTITEALESSLTGSQLVPQRVPPQAALHRVPLDTRLTLAKHAADLGAVVLLAQTGNPPPYEQAEMIGRERPELWSDLPYGVLRLVAGEDGASALTNTAQLEQLVGRSGHRSSFVLEAVLGKFLLSAAQGNAPLQSASPEFWASERARQVVRQWIEKHTTRPAGELAAVLDWLPPEIEEAITDVPAVRRARHPDLELDLGPADDDSLKAAIAAAGNALAHRKLDEPAWAEIAKACAHSQLGPNPVKLIAENIAADRERHESYTRNGAVVLERAVQANPGLMEISFTFRDELPLFTLLLRTSSPGLTLSEAALRLIDWRLKQRSEGVWSAWLASLVCGIRGSTRLSGVRGSDDSADVALARVARALIHPDYPNEVRLGMLAHVHPLQSERRKELP